MEVILTEKLNLKIHKLPYEVTFSFNSKKDSRYNHWFTPTGKCRISVHGCHTEQLGNLTNEDYDSLMSQMKASKCDILTDGRYFYTTGNNFILKITNMYLILSDMNNEWNTRFVEI